MANPYSRQLQVDDSSELNKKEKNPKVWLHWKEVKCCAKAEEISQVY